MSSDAGSIPAASMKKLLRYTVLKIKLVRQRDRSIFLVGIVFLLLTVGFSQSQAQRVLKISVNDFQNFSRVIIRPSFPFYFDLEKSSSLLLIKINTGANFRIQKDPFVSRLVESFGWAKGEDDYILTIKIKTPDFSYKYFSLDNPAQLVLDFNLLREENKENRPPYPDTSPLASSKDQFAASSGLRTIVIDPGHGGLETGARGKFGTLEKEITLAISQKLKAIIERNLDFRIVLTREKDVDCSLESRAALANNNKAYLFISIHTNSSYRKGARGSETFFLSLNATDEEARKLAYLENNQTEFKEGITGENQDDLKMILWDMAQTAYLKKSSLLAESIQKELNILLGTVNRGVKQAPFKVLAGVACPAVLVEVAFLSNPEEERKLLIESFQNRVAWAVYRGLVNFIQKYTQE